MLLKRGTRREKMEGNQGLIQTGSLSIEYIGSEGRVNDLGIKVLRIVKNGV